MENTQQSYKVGVGAILGACIGDACGAPLENLGRLPKPTEVNDALLMKGGGSHATASGQVTDDGEQTLSLARALVQCGREYNADIVAKSYSEWLKSEPFDAGVTTFNSIGSAVRMERSGGMHLQHLNEVGYAKVMTNASQKMCMPSQANGSLMRASPLGVWGWRLSDVQLAEVAKIDSSLSHPNDVCTSAVGAYSIAIASLMREPKKNKEAFQRAQDWSNQYAAPEVKIWLQEAKDNIRTPYFPGAGHVRIGFTHAFRHLYLGTSFSNAIKETLEGGGDTDTNACIVGGLLGSYWTVDDIPKTMQDAVLTCNTKKGRPRPEWLHPEQIPGIVEKFLV